VVTSDVRFQTQTFTDETMPPRVRAFTPRMQSRLPKILAFEVFPGFDVYIWADAAFQMRRKDSIKWLLDILRGHDAAFFPHPFRSSIQAEADFIREKLPSSRRLIERYQNEDGDGLLASIKKDPAFVDNRLYAAGVFAYVKNARTCAMMRDWWYHVTRFHLNDQLSLPYVLWRHQIDVVPVTCDIYDCPFFTFTRRSKPAAHVA